MLPEWDVRRRQNRTSNNNLEVASLSVFVDDLFHAVRAAPRSRKNAWKKNVTVT